MKLTDATVAALKMPAGKTEHFWWDESLPGFGLRARQETKQALLSLRWYVQYRAGGQQRRESLGDVRKYLIFVCLHEVFFRRNGRQYAS